MSSLSHVEKSLFIKKFSSKVGYKNKRIRKNIFVENVNFSIWSLKLLGVLPLRTTIEGSIDWNLQSCVMLYCLFVYLIVVVMGVIVIYYTATEIGIHNKLKFAEKVEAFNIIVSNIFMAILPPLNWIESRAYVLYLRQWASFEVKYDEITHDTLRISTGRRSAVILIMIAITQVIIQTTVYLTDQYQNVVTILSVIANIFYFLYHHLWVFHWYLTCHVLGETSRKVGEKCRQAVSGSSVRVFLQYRTLWTDLVQLGRGMGSYFPYTFKVLILYMFITLTMCVYNMLVELSTGIRNVYNVVAFLNSSLLLFILCSSSHRMTTKIHEEIENFIRFLQASNEIGSVMEQAVQGMMLNVQMYPPEIVLSGYVTVNRQLLVSLTSMIVTYMVVLVQMDMSIIPTNSTYTASVSKT